MTPAFQPGAQLSAAYYREAVAPLLVGVPHSAALLGYGSDVIGMDTERSTDHGWGPRCTVLVADDEDVERVTVLLEAGLPATFRGWPTRYGWDAVPVAHHVTVATVQAWMLKQLGVDPTLPLEAIDWLLLPQQRLLEVVAGPIFHDGLGDLEAIRVRLEWYPDPVWVWLLGCAWQRISQEEAFVGRTSEVGDELGSSVVAARQVRELMRLSLLIERRYAPYSKWLGTAFTQLEAAATLDRPLREACTAASFEARQGALSTAYEHVARAFNALGLTVPIDPTVRPYHGRPYDVLHADRFVVACTAVQTDERLRAMPPIGGIDQLIDSTDALCSPRLLRRAAGMFG